MKTSARHILNLFEIRADYLLEKTNSDKWITVLEILSQYPLDVLREELKQILAKENGEQKSRYYYMEAVRRNLGLKEHEERKQAPVADSIKEVLRRMAL